MSVAYSDTASSNNAFLLKTNIAAWRCPSATGGDGGSLPYALGGTTMASTADYNMVYIPAVTNLGAGGIAVTIDVNEGIADYIWVDGVRVTFLDLLENTEGNPS